MVEQDIRLRCSALTRKGTPCSNYPLQGSEYCRVHQTVRSDLAVIETQDNEEINFGPSEEAAEEISDARLRRQLILELGSLVDRVKGVTPEYSPPAFSSRELSERIRRNLGNFSSGWTGIFEKLRSTVSDDMFDPDTWKGVWYMLNYTVDYQRDFVRRRISGDYQTDEWGFDQEILDAVKPFLDFMYFKYWRVQTSGLEKIPEDGRALLIVNHSGQLPWDGAMLGAAVYNEHPSQRLVRTLYSVWLPTVPFFSALFTKLGQALGTEDNARRLLEQDQLIAVFPEGAKGVSKLYKDRYRLTRFGGDNFIRVALTTNTPIIPVSIVGAEETYISLANSASIARMIGVPSFPITITWPWLGLLGFVPLPSKWYIDIGDPIVGEDYGTGAATDLVLLSQLTDQVRNQIQDMIFVRLAQRRSVFAG